MYVAQPPLFRVRSRKETYYIQTEDEMKTQLLEQGLGDGVFLPGDGREVSGEQMTSLCRTLAGLEDALLALERRGISLRDHAGRQDPSSGKLPIYHVFYGAEERWFTTRSELDAFLAEQEQASGGELAVGRSSDGRPVEGEGAAQPDAQAGPELVVIELHEVRSINSGLADLAAMGFDIESLLPQERTGSEEPRYVLKRGESEIGLEDLRSLL